MNIEKPTYTAGWVDTYIAEVPGNDLLPALEQQAISFRTFIQSLPPEKLEYRYAPGKWTIAEVIVHLIDTERVFSYRALRFSRHDPTELPGYDENIFAAHSFATGRSAQSLLAEYEAVRRSTLELYRNMDASCLDLQGTANGTTLTARTLGYAVAGHELHHRTVLLERYLTLKNA